MSQPDIFDRLRAERTKCEDNARELKRESAARSYAGGRAVGIEDAIGMIQCDEGIQSLITLARKLAQCEPKNKSRFANLIIDAQTHFRKWPEMRDTLAPVLKKEMADVG